VTAEGYFTSQRKAGRVRLPTALPDDRRLLASVLALAAALALLHVGVLALGKFGLLPEGIPVLWLAAITSLGAAAAVGYLVAGWLLAWTAAAVVVLPFAWVLALGGPPEVEPSRLDVAVVASRLAVPYGVVAGTTAYLCGRGVRRLAPAVEAN